MLKRLVVNHPFGLPISLMTMDNKNQLIEDFANCCEAMRVFLHNLHQPISKLALIVEKGKEGFDNYEDLVKSCLNDIFNLVRYFKTIIHRDLSYRDDLIGWAFDLQDTVFELSCCKNCYVL